MIFGFSEIEQCDRDPMTPVSMTNDVVSIPSKASDSVSRGSTPEQMKLAFCERTVRSRRFDGWDQAKGAGYLIDETSD